MELSKKDIQGVQHILGQHFGVPIDSGEWDPTTQQLFDKYLHENDETHAIQFAGSQPGKFVQLGQFLNYALDKQVSLKDALKADLTGWERGTQTKAELKAQGEAKKKADDAAAAAAKKTQEERAAVEAAAVKKRQEEAAAQVAEASVDNPPAPKADKPLAAPASPIAQAVTPTAQDTAPTKTSNVDAKDKVLAPEAQKTVVIDRK